MSNAVSNQDLLDRGFTQKDMGKVQTESHKSETKWEKTLKEGIIVLVKDGNDLFLPRFEPNGRDEQKFYDEFHSSGIPSEKITNLEELDEYIDAIQELFNANIQS